MRLIVGLGNPGYEYELTPHNLGFAAVDRLAESCGVEVAHPEAQALTAVAEIEKRPAVLAKPQTFMNLSGLAVAKLLEKYTLTPQNMIVLVDDLALPLGKLRIRRRGSAGGHNGLKSIIGVLQSDEFLRVRMGIQPGRHVEDPVAYVLAPFCEMDLEAVAGMLDLAAEAVRAILRDGAEAAMARYNRRVASQSS